MKNLLKIGIAAAFGIAALAGATNNVRLNSELSHEQSVVEQKRARGWLDPLPNIIGTGNTVLSATKNQIYKYTFTSFSTSYYTIECSSNDQTYLGVKSPYEVIFDGGDTNQNNNAKIQFLGVAWETYTIYVARDGSLNPQLSIDITLTLREAEATCIINGYQSYMEDTIAEFECYMFNCMNNRYEYEVLDSPTKNEIVGQLNKEFFFMNGFADLQDPSKLYCNGGTFEVSDIGSMNKTRLALWGSPNTGNPGSFASSALSHGAKCSIGFNSLNVTQNNASGFLVMQFFCQKLIYELGVQQNKTIQHVLDYTLETYSDVLGNNFSLNITIYGNSNFKLFDHSVDNHAFDITKTFLSPMPTPGHLE